ncbi:uncharacterized protein TNCV_4927601 [Trichonephila clavipes]|nr:uncharacterized protein TNCV_4927601 [Trichonephila clavipes]
MPPVINFPRAISYIAALLCDSVNTSYVCFLHLDGLRFLTRGIGLIASRQEIPCFILVEAIEGDSPLPLALLLEAIADVGMSHAHLVEDITVSLLEFSEIANTCLPASEILVGYRDGDRFNSCQVIYSQFVLAIHQNDHQARRRFVEWAQNEIAIVPDFHKRILLSDVAHFWLNGYVNKQNCRIWSEANPQVYVETQLHREKLTVWCALWAGGIIGPYFFKNDEGHNVTVNGDRGIEP